MKSTGSKAKKRSKKKIKLKEEVENPKAPKKRGRKPKKRLVKGFNKTKLGVMLIHEAPVVYELIMKSCNKFEPDPEIVRIICESSGIDLFEQNRFKRYMAEYEKYTISPPSSKNPNDNLIESYRENEKRSIRRYYCKNKQLIKQIIKSGNLFNYNC